MHGCLTSLDEQVVKGLTAAVSAGHGACSCVQLKTEHGRVRCDVGVGADDVHTIGRQVAAAVAYRGDAHGEIVIIGRAVS